MAEGAKAGDMPHRIEVQAHGKPVKQLESGEETPVWETIATRWFGIEARGRVPGGELVLGQQVSAEATHKIKMRFFEDSAGNPLTTKHRLKWGRRIFQIEAISNPDERKGTTPMVVFVKEQV